MIRGVVFDVGECLVDETTEYGTWADWLGVPRHTFSAVFGAVIARGGDYRETFGVFRPGFDLDLERERRAAAGVPETFGEGDLYPDARSTLERLQGAGFWIGVAGNQTARAGRILKALRLPADLVTTSAELGVAKPEPGFFARIVAASSYGPEEICYVGDRLDWDIRPATQAGLHTAWLRRGPWGYILDDEEAAAKATFHIATLDELPHRLAAFNASR